MKGTDEHLPEHFAARAVDWPTFVISGGFLVAFVVAAIVIGVAPEWRSLGGLAVMPVVVLAANSAHFASSTVRLYTKPGATVDFPFVAYGLPLVAPGFV